jgi:uncharacterized membrane protein
MSKKSEEIETNRTSNELIQLEEELKTVDPTIFDGINPAKKKALLSTTLIHVRSHSGPLPDPESMASYNSIIPNGAERLMAMAEKEQENRHSIQNKIIGSKIQLAIRGQLIGLFIGTLGICGALYLSYNDHDTVAAIIGGTTVVTLVSAFIFGKNQENKK